MNPKCNLVGGEIVGKTSDNNASDLLYVNMHCTNPTGMTWKAGRLGERITGRKRSGVAYHYV